MNSFTPVDPNFAIRVKDSFHLQNVMTTIGATMQRVAAGMVQIAMPYRADLTQQHGYLHAGIVTTIVDSACGYAAYTLMPAQANVLTIEYKVNFLSPAKGDSFVATGQVIKAGRTITVCEGHVMAQQGASEKLIVTMQATIMCLMPDNP
jgi:uncharacterized protein (TIGR00369 family)